MEKIEEVDDEAAHVPGELAQQTHEQLRQQLLTAYTAQIYPRIHSSVGYVLNMVLRSRIRINSISDPGSKFFPSRISIKEIKYFLPKKLILRSRKYDPGVRPGSRSRRC
jgi:hypothetical protein